MTLRYLAVAASVGGVVCGTAHADLHTLDIASGSGTQIDWMSVEAGLGGVPFSVASSNLNFKEHGFATQGVVRAWDFEASQNAMGVLTLTAAEGHAFDSFGFDLSGKWQDFSHAQIGIYLDGELWRFGSWHLNGNSTLVEKFWAIEGGATEIRLELSNLTNNAAAGLDNIEIGSFSTVPAPGALALLGLAGVAGTRRRRG